MVLPNLFTKNSAKKKHKSDDNDRNDPAASRDYDSPPISPSKKSSSPSKSPTKGKENARPASPHPGRSYSKSSNSPRYTYDRSSHPLNLPPHELRRLSALSTMSDPPTPMEVDQEEEGPASTLPSSPPPMSPQTQPSTNGVSNGASNGINGGMNGMNEDGSPIPPPHKTPTSPPPQEAQSQPQQPPKPTVDAEACKAAGNKFFKAKDYDKAIAEYTKGMHTCILVTSLAVKS